MAQTLRRERKIVTCLFCDLVGFTQRAEGLDPEDVAALLSPYQARLKAELERHGGTVEKFIGDAVMALFGAPAAHEDDPERAVRAALAIREFAREEAVELRIGISTGEALVWLDARPDAGETMATGDVVNTASRLQTAAPVNGIIVSDRTYQATKDAIDYREAEAVVAKGKAHPIAAWEALQARSRVVVERVHGAPLVGRARELRLLKDALAHSRQERSPQLVTLIGVPGIGKSRLVFELYDHIEADPELIRWRLGRCLPYGEGVTFWALAEMVKAETGILETDTAEDTEVKLRLGIPDERVRSHLRALVGLGTDAEPAVDRRSEAFVAWRRFFEGLAEQGPLVLVFEDLHWADESLLDFIDYLVDWASGVQLLVVCTARPELLERRPGWGGGKPNALALSLSPLSDDETARLIEELLYEPLVEPGTVSALVARAGGNPLYAEQYVRMLHERRSSGELSLPETVQGIIAARLDALLVQEKGLLQDAAVLGKTFTLGGIAFVSGEEGEAIEERLHDLERKEFVRRQTRVAAIGEREYSFRHLLVRDVAYAQIPRAERAERHRRAAQWVESLGRPDDQAEVLAHHYLQALALARATGVEDKALAEGARLALRDAGDRALALNALPAAARFYDQALELWPESDPDLPQLLFRHGSALRNTGPGAEALEAAYEALVAAGETELAAESQAMLATLAWHHGDQDRCATCLVRAAELLQDAPVSRAKAYVLGQVSRYRMLSGDGVAAIPVGEEALTMAEELGLDDVRASVLNTVGTARVYNLGDENGFRYLEESIALSLLADSPECVRGYTNLSGALWLAGRLHEGIEAMEAGRRAAKRFGDEVGDRFLLGHVMNVRYHGGRWDDCLALADELIAEAEGGSPHYGESMARLFRALIRVGRDDATGAVADVEALLAVSRRLKDAQALEPALGVAAFVLWEADEAHEACELARELVSMSLSNPARVVSDYALSIAWVATDVGIERELTARLDAAPDGWLWHEAARAVVADDYERAADTFAEMGAVTEEARARQRAAKLLKQGRSVAADAQVEHALAFWRSVGATRYVRQCEELMEAST